MHVLIVGERQVGKSTLIKKLITALAVPVAGFETKKEDALTDPLLGTPIYIYEAGKPHIQDPDRLLAYSKVGKPKARDGVFESFVPLLLEAAEKDKLILMDELGFLESSSPLFCQTVLSVLDGSKTVLAAVKPMDTDFLLAVRNHENCRCFYITEENRDELFYEILSFLSEKLPI